MRVCARTIRSAAVLTAGAALLVTYGGAARAAGEVAGAGQPVAPAAPQLAASTDGPRDTGAVRQGAMLAAGQRPATLPRGTAFWVLQLNLCNSGLAGCYENGQSVPEAAAMIKAQLPDTVTLNEICSPDLDVLATTAMAQTWPGDWIFWAFRPAHDKARNAPYLCKNGQQYGIGVIGHVAPANWADTNVRGGIYPTQDANSNEQRVWLCVYAIGNYYTCTTHLAANAAGIAMAQCHYLMNTAIPAARTAMGGYSPTVVGGDLNLKYGGNPNVQDCVPAGWFRKGDDGVQHILATSDFTFQFTRKINMSHTDHDAWLVALRTP
jgi:hypothetical protein